MALVTPWKMPHFYLSSPVHPSPIIMPKILFIGASGNIGRAAIPRLLREPETTIVALTSDAAKLEYAYQERPYFTRVSIEVRL